ncbi:hypothetical protein OKA05_16175 [Luteolibacter arcticus]|uniref:Uncharacterized protein n=1 Tax=Luteolibacter arcticus TaxID=1581411 RepID=A0ABT3GKQ7_9BACT|nr:choice-of-anchor tandem repeat NxxGxxAF-containing protein [Luteolibacter arcticus]MCW1924105.1 hypothetical protein [Luteolibacter arcticus]
MKFTALSLCVQALPFLVAALPGTSSAATVVIAIYGQSVPGGNGTYTFVEVPSISNSGQVAFRSVLGSTSGGADDNLVIMRGNSGTEAVQLVRKGQASPDGNGVFSTFRDPALNNHDVAVFLIYLSGTTGGTSDDSGIFKSNGVAAPIPIVREGQPAPDAVGVFSFFGEYYVMNDAGQAAFNGSINLNNGGGLLDQDGIFRGDGVTGPVQIARRGQATPTGNGTYAFFDEIALNESGQVAFWSSLTGTTGGGNDNEGVFRGDGAAPTVTIAREGQAVPAGNGEFFLFNSPVMNDAGQVAFFANLRNTSGGDNDNLGIFRGDGATGPVTIARRGEAVPGGSGTFWMFGRETINQAGVVAVTVDINLNNGEGPYDEEGIILGDGTPGGITMVARTGQAVPGGNGTLYTFTNPALNNAGQLAFRASILKPGGGSEFGLFFFDPLEGLFLICRAGAPFLGSTVDTFNFFNSGGYPTDGRTGLNESGEVAFEFVLDNGKEGIARWSTAPGPVIPLQITDFQMEPPPPWDPFGYAQVILQWKTSSNATSFNVRYSDDLSLPTSEWPLMGAPVPREEPVTTFETGIPAFFLPPKLFFVVEEVE